jgi:glucose/arabinose dehydrogenase
VKGKRAAPVPESEECRLMRSGSLRLSHGSRSGSVRAAAFVALLALAAPPVASQTSSLPGGFSETLVASGISFATAMEFAPNGSLFVAEQTGALRVIQGNTLLPTPFVSMTVESIGERGLLGVTFHPDFANNPYVYVYHTVPCVNGPSFNRVTRFLTDPVNPTIALDAGTPVLTLPPLSGLTNHNGGAIHFGRDGKLYVAVGENANPPLARDMTTPFGKVLRLNPDGTTPGDNPFVGVPGVDDRIYASGFRNPFTFAVQPGTGRIFVNDVGQNTFEEVNDLLPGADYGWFVTEGPNPPGVPGITYPFYSYLHGGGPDQGFAITGGAFYNPLVSTFAPSFVGDYFYADLINGWIRVLDTSSNSNASSAFATGIPIPVDLKVSSDGGLYYLARGFSGSPGGSSVYRINGQFSFSTAAAPEPASLALLAAAGLFLVRRRKRRAVDKENP